ncbi:MAG: radical SAM protein [Magnetococcales bacterium]|nr:radical SAM protein [Magnetococcales bacterium]
MRLLLIFPLWTTNLGSYGNSAKRFAYPPLNLCIMATIAREAGHDVRVIDAELEDIGPEQMCREIDLFKPDLIGITATTPSVHNTRLFASAIKDHCDIPVILGGPHTTLLREKALEPMFDYIYIGECETVLVDLLASFESGEKGAGVPGLMWQDADGTVQYTGDVSPSSDLDAIPWPDRRLLPIEKYMCGAMKGGEMNYTSLIMSRGCPYKCVFCATDLYGTKIRRRSIANVMAEIEEVVLDLGIQHINFLDDVLTLSRRFIMELCDEIEQRGLKFTWEGSTRVNLWDEEMVRRMQECGLIRISFGLETADPKVRELIRKGVSLEEHVVAVKLNKKLGLETSNSVMLGMPGETRESIERTIEFLSKSKEIQNVSYNIAVPYPGTELAEMAKRGEHGLELLSEDYARYQRYSDGVLKVNGITPEELVELQRDGLRRIYSHWWRVLPTIRRHGLKNVLEHVWVTFKASLVRIFQRESASS